MSLALLLSEDEALVVVVSILLWIPSWIWSLWELRAGPVLRRERAPARALGFLPFVALGILFLILKLWSSFDVRDSGPYLFQYLALGGAWLGIALRFFPRFGISARDDVAERGNPAAAVALSGAILGLVLCYAGGNIGDGPGWWVVVFSSGLATVGFFVSWAAFESTAQASDAVTIDCDLASGARHASFSVAQGMVLGRAAAGDWRSASHTLSDFVSHGWPALVLLALAIAFERVLRPTGAEPRRSLVVCGVVPGAVLVAGALAWIATIGVGV